MFYGKMVFYFGFYCHDKAHDQQHVGLGRDGIILFTS